MNGRRPEKWSASRPKPEAAQPAHAIYALKYAGPFVSSRALVRWMEGWDETVERNYYLWAVRAPDGETTLVDAGTGPTLAGERQLKNYVNPVDMVARAGVQPHQVTRVVLTHIHFDHVGGMELFPQAYPKARFYVQKKEYDFWFKNPLASRTPFRRLADPVANKALSALKGTGRLAVVDGDRNLCPGIDLLLLPGHTVGLQAVAVHTPAGPAILASDCAHVAQSFEDDVPSCLITDLLAWLQSFEKLRALAPLERIFPGHDVSMARDYPQVAPDVTRLA
jgi:glyoxylase-like metal-dependent hydrolase (beta-lactamase superfamily II)